jgi:hypothetical protein
MAKRMQLHGVIADTGPDAVMADIARAARRGGLELTVELAPFDGGVELRAGDGEEQHVRILARLLAETHESARFVACEIAAGSRGAELNAIAWVTSDGEIQEHDITAAAKNLLGAWTGGGEVHEEELVAQGLAAALLERDPDGFKPAKVLRCHKRSGL